VRREYQGAAAPAQLTANLAASAGALSISCTSLANWPTGSIGPFYVVIDRGETNEEKILCVSRAGNTLAVYNSGGVNGRAADDTSITAHNTNAVIEHVHTATDADEANLHTNTSSLHVNAGQAAINVCTSSTRPASPAANTVILETNTQNMYVYISGDWELISPNPTGITYSDILLLGGM
jgi:hypothetical protein